MKLLEFIRAFLLMCFLLFDDCVIFIKRILKSCTEFISFLSALYGLIKLNAQESRNKRKIRKEKRIMKTRYVYPKNFKL